MERHGFGGYRIEEDIQQFSHDISLHRGMLILDIPLMHMLFCHPQTCCMMDLAVDWDSHSRSEIAYGGHIATTVLIEGWLVI